VANGRDLDCFHLIVNQVQHSVIADPNPVAIVTMQLLDSGWARVVLQFEKLGGNAAMQGCRQTGEFLLSGSFENDRVSHVEWLLGFSSGEIFAERSSRFVAALLDCGHVEQIFPKLTVVQQMFDHRFPFARFEAAESLVHAVGSLSYDVCHAPNLLARTDFFNAGVADRQRLTVAEVIG